MKDWVKPFILQRAAEHVDEWVKDGSENKQWLALKSEALKDAEIVYYELTSFLRCHFGREIGDPQEFFYKVFGSVLADLPEEVFKKLCGMRNLFFTYNPNPAAEVKIFEFDHDIPERTLQVVTFPYCSGFMPPMVLRGEIVHELVCAYTGLVGIVEEENRIDSIAIEWGFEREMETLRNHRQKKGSEEREQPVKEAKPRSSLRAFITVIEPQD